MLSVGSIDTRLIARLANRVDAICVFGGRCFTADELRLLAFTHVAVWYMGTSNLQQLRRLVCALRFGVQEDRPAGDGYIYSNLRRFFTEIERIARVANLYYEVGNSEDSYTIINHCKTWYAKFYRNGDVEITTDDKHVLRIAGNEMQPTMRRSIMYALVLHASTRMQYALLRLPTLPFGIRTSGETP